MSSKIGDKEIFLKMLLVAIVLAALLILPQSMISSWASSGSVSSSMSLYPTRIQEGLNTNITLTIRDASANTTYPLKINVTTSNNISHIIDQVVETDGTGSGANSSIYPNDFAGANTDFIGLYKVTIKNATSDETLATSNFTVGLTDKLRYFRSETVSIRGSGYGPNEPVTVDVKFGGISVFSKSVNASANGVVSYSWQIPANTQLGVYTVTLTNATSPGTIKLPADIQTLTVEGLCEIQTRNLADEPVGGVSVDVYNATSGLFINQRQETNQTGWVKFVLEAGNYTFKAFWKSVEVGAPLNQNVTENIALQLEVRLSNLKLLVTDIIGAPMPFVDLNLMYNYTTKANQTISETGSFTTDINGMVRLQNSFTRINYLIEARKYGLLFNTTFIENLPEQAWNNITIMAPTYSLSVQVLDSKDAQAVDLKVAVYEWSSGLSDPLQLAQTDSNGNVTFSLTVGRYRIRVYQNTTFVNEYTVDLVQNPSFLVVHIDVYNVDLSVLVVDYFGQPISNVSVELQRKNYSNYETTETKTTGSDGVASFIGIIGGDSRVYVSVAGRPGEIQYLHLVGPTSNVVFKMDGYVAVAGYALETSQFVTVVILLIIVVAFIVASTYKRLPRLLQRRKK